MFRKSLIISYIFLSAVALFLFIPSFFPTKKDALFLEKLTRKSEKKASFAKMIRKNVHKEITIYEDPSFIYLSSPISTMHIEHKQTRPVIEEKMEKVLAYIDNSQEKMIFSSDMGLYHFPSHRFTFDEVDLSLLQNKNIPLLHAQAKSMDIVWQDKKPLFELHNLHSHFDMTP